MLAYLPFPLQAEGVQAKQEDLSISEDRGEAGILRRKQG